MSDAPHPRDAEASEYVLGTLDLAERRTLERDMAGDPALARAVRAWEARLDPLADAVAPVEPGAALWSAIQRAVAGEGGDRQDGARESEAEIVDLARHAALRRSRSLWRGVAVGASALAAMLALYVAADRAMPGPAQPTLVAVVNRSGELPALLVRIDPRAGLVQVRAMAAETPPDHSLELWSVRAGEAPRSLGIVGAAVTRAVLPAGSAGRLENATIAVSVEPRGGSATGLPTGPVVYTGRLVSETP